MYLVAATAYLQVTQADWASIHRKNFSKTDTKSDYTISP